MTPVPAAESGTQRHVSPVLKGGNELVRELSA
jgi:hypothetical protein